MGGKPRIIPNRTYVLDPKDLEEMEELTIGTVMQEALDVSDNSPGDTAETPECGDRQTPTPGSKD
jgi:hypothetical protein